MFIIDKILEGGFNTKVVAQSLCISGSEHTLQFDFFDQVWRSPSIDMVSEQSFSEYINLLNMHMEDSFYVHPLLKMFAISFSLLDKTLCVVIVDLLPQCTLKFALLLGEANVKNVTITIPHTDGLTREMINSYLVDAMTWYNEVIKKRQCRERERKSKKIEREEQLNALWFAPGMPGCTLAQKHFNETFDKGSI
jgi:hypothetical protein